MSPNERGEDIRRRRQLVEGVLGMVEAIALKLAGLVGHRCLEELRAAGHLGAVQAAHAFDPEAGTPFEGYAWPRVFGAMIDLLRKERPRLPPETAATIEKAAAVLDAASPGGRCGENGSSSDRRPSWEPHKPEQTRPECPWRHKGKLEQLRAFVSEPARRSHSA